jgi:hypothetical protein
MDEMQSRRPHSRVQWGGEEFGYQRIVQQANSPMALRQQMLVSNLFQYVKEIQNIDDGYALQFYRSDDLDDLIGKMADYIVFESRHAPRLTFAIVEEPRAKTFWLYVRSLADEKHNVTKAYASSDSLRSCEDPVSWKSI